MEPSFENLNLSGNFSHYEQKIFDRLKSEYVALLDGKTYEYYTEKKDLRCQTELNKKMQQIEAFYSSPEKRKEMITPEIYVEALGKLFGEKNLEQFAVPELEDLDDDYFKEQYPATQRDADNKRGLKCYQPDWWNKLADEAIRVSGNETWGKAYARAMKAEVEKLQNQVIFSETLVKPKYIDGSQQYGDIAGNISGKDWLIPIIQNIFGKEQRSRYNLTWDQIQKDLIPKVKEKIKEELKTAGLPILEFEVMITPSLISREVMEKHPEISQTDTYEWTSTPLLDKNNQDSGRRLLVGLSFSGGAGYVFFNVTDTHWYDRGFRLSVGFRITGT